jgi:DNA adenine methylase
MHQKLLFERAEIVGGVKPFLSQLLKWIGNKQRFAHEIAAYFPRDFGTYYEPFLGSGAVLATLAPRAALASDNFGPLMEIWRTLKASPQTLQHWYAERWRSALQSGKRQGYERVKASYPKLRCCDVRIRT